MKEKNLVNLNSNLTQDLIGRGFDFNKINLESGNVHPSLSVNDDSIVDIFKQKIEEGSLSLFDIFKSEKEYLLLLLKNFTQKQLCVKLGLKHHEFSTAYYKLKNLDLDGLSSKKSRPTPETHPILFEFKNKLEGMTQNQKCKHMASLTEGEWQALIAESYYIKPIIDTLKLNSSKLRTEVIGNYGADFYRRIKEGAITTHIKSNTSDFDKLTNIPKLPLCRGIANTLNGEEIKKLIDGKSQMEFCEVLGVKSGFFSRGFKHNRDLYHSLEIRKERPAKDPEIGNYNSNNSNGVSSFPLSKKNQEVNNQVNEMPPPSSSIFFKKSGLSSPIPVPGSPAFFPRFFLKDQSSELNLAQTLVSPPHFNEQKNVNLMVNSPGFVSYSDQLKVGQESFKDFFCTNVNMK